MKFGSAVNAIADASRRGQPEPEVGMGATILSWSDRHPATVINVERFKTGLRAGQVKRVTVQYDLATRTDKNGMSDSQEYEFKRNPEGSVTTFTANKDGRFSGPSGSLAIGYRAKYYDYSF